MKQGFNAAMSCLILVLFASAAEAASSFRLTNYVQSSGTTGSKPVMLHEEAELGLTVAERMQALEDIRLEYLNGIDAESKLVIGVDVNENASGTEKSETQAVALSRSEWKWYFSTIAPLT